MTNGLRERLGDQWVLATLVATALLGLAARFFRLGERVMYYDEAWFGYWALKYLDHGYWQYRPTLHGPFYTWVNRFVFPVFGANDFTARIVVALIGGLLPLVAWLYRDRLRDVEVVAFGLLLAFNPVLLYYSRFMRKDVPLIAFMLLVLGLAIRAYETRDRRYAYAGAVALGVAFTTKESALLWLVSWAGGTVLVAGNYALRRSDGYTVPALRRPLRSAVRTAKLHLAYWRRPLAVAGLLFLTVIVLTYAPRSGDRGTIGLWRALGGEFGMLPTVVLEATVGSVVKVYEHWVLGGKQSHPYVPYLMDTLRTLWAGALGVCLLAVVGYVHEQATRPRPVIEVNFYAGCAAIVGYPIANHFPVPWSTIHAIAPLTLSAAVGAGVVYRWSRHDLPDEERAFAYRLRTLGGRIGTGDGPPSGGARAGATVLPLPGALREWAADNPDLASGVRETAAAGLLLVLAISAAATAVQTNYVAPHESPRDGTGGNEIVYYAQPPADLRVTTDAIRRAAATGGDDVDVLYVGSELAMDESAIEYPPETGAWYARNPLPWYTESAGADVASVASPDAVGSAPPPVVIAEPRHRAVLEEQLPGYDVRRQPLDDVGGRPVVVFTRF